LCGLAAVLVTGVAAVPGAAALAQTPADTGRTISTVGTGIVMSQAGATRTVLGVEVSNPSLVTAHAEATGRAEVVQQRLRTAGVRVGRNVDAKPSKG